MGEGNEQGFINYLEAKERKEQAMKCPLMLMTWQPTEEKKKFEPMNCLKEECGLWVETQDRCAIKDVALSLGFISTDITQLLEKMPHAGQFKK